MNQDPTVRWSPMVSNPEDDFANFLDFGDLNFATFSDAVNTTQPADNGILQDDGGAMSSPPERSAPLSRVEEQGQISHTMAPMPLMDYCQELYHAGLDPYEQQQQNVAGMQQQQWHPPSMVPPTPNSIELHAGQMQGCHGSMDPHLLQQQQLYEQLRRQQKEQLNFTPLISPAVTPLDTQFRYADVPIEPFSPLTSPALQAQNQTSHTSVYSTVRGSDTSNTTSPIDYNLEYPAPTSVSTPASVRRSRRKMSTSSVKNASRAPKRSPAMKPQSKKKQPSSAVIPPKEVSNVIEQASKNQGANVSSSNPNGQLTSVYNHEGSGADSISPEPLSDILMPPPATPRSNSAGRSPYLTGTQIDSHSNFGQNGGPATPASLMSIRKQAGKAKLHRQEAARLKKQATLAETDMGQILEDIVLPEPAVDSNKKPALQAIDTRQANAGNPDASGSAPKNQGGGPMSAPVTATNSTFPSPAASAVASPQALGAGKRTDSQLKGRDSKKRGNIGNEKASPALRPRISPGIQPLLPGSSTVSSETSALLLASKSNYQNILEGTHFPGVSYPENLSTNLSSKRTSHKIAEQGRRNRINTALQEIATLLPPTTPTTQPNGKVVNGIGENERAAAMMTGSSQQQSNSKASTVEAAIDYIKSLQDEVKVCKERLAGYENDKAQQTESDGSNTSSGDDANVNQNMASESAIT